MGNKSKNVSAWDHSKAGSFQSSLGIINYFISSQQTVGSDNSFSGGASDEDGSIATLDKAVMEVHAEQTRGNGWVGIEMIYNNLFHNGFNFKAGIGIEPDQRVVTLSQLSSHGN